MLELKKINKAFAAVVALKDASFTLNKGEIVALLGANGSGKSTMIKILGGSVKNDSGEIFIDGKEVKIPNSGASRRLKIAVAYQELSLLPRMTVYENVMLGHYIIGKFGRIDEAENRRYVQDLLDRYRVDCSLDDYPQDLPAATLSLVEIVKAVSWKPDVLLLDEVTATLHHNEVGMLFENLKMLAKDGTSIVIVTHRLGEIYEIASRAVILRNGESVADVKLEDTDVDKIVFYMTGKMPEKTDENANHVQHEDKDIVLDIKDMCVGDSVKNVNLKVARGEIIGLGGLEGQGQSQFLRSLYGVTPFTAGEVIFDKKSVCYKDVANAVKDSMGFISGDRNRESVFAQRSIGENIYSAKLSMKSDLTHVSDRMMHKQTQRIVEDYNIKIGSIEHPISSLSGGNQQKVVFGRWIFVTPKLLLLDDPTKGVDVSARRELHNFLRKAADDGMTVLMVSSDNDELLEVSDRIYVFFEGGINAELSGTDRTEEKLVAAMMGLNRLGKTAKGADA